MNNEIRTLCVDTDKVNIDKNMALRFLRLRQKILDEECQSVFDECYDEIIKAISFKASYRYFDISIREDVVSFSDAMSLQSKSLCKNLEGCKGAFVFVATCSSGVDRLINKHSKLRVSHALIVDAIGSAAIEGFCDYLCSMLSQQFCVSLNTRFSPGYGDLSLLCQKEVLSLCDSMRKIGVTMTDNHMMVPTKSVSAIVGVCDKE